MTKKWCQNDAGRCVGTKTGNFQLTANRAVNFTTLASALRRTCINWLRVVGRLLNRDLSAVNLKITLSLTKGSGLTSLQMNILTNTVGNPYLEICLEIGTPYGSSTKRNKRNSSLEINRSEATMCVFEGWRRHLL